MEIYKEVETINEFIDAIRLRVDVFIKEQGFQPGWEPDEDDKVSRHFIVVSDNNIIGTVRAREIAKGEFKIERMAVKKEYRNKNIGTCLIEYVLNEIKKLNPMKIWLRSQVRSQKFWEKCGFKGVSEPYDIYGTFHIDMKYTKLQK